MLTRSFLKRLKSALGFYLSWDFCRGKRKKRLFLGPVESVRLAWNLARLEEAQARENEARRRIEQLFAYLSQDPAGNEGFCVATVGPDSMRLPLIASDPDHLDAIAPIAEQLAEAASVTIVLAQFGARKDLREIRPGA